MLSHFVLQNPDPNAAMFKCAMRCWNMTVCIRIAFKRRRQAIIWTDAGILLIGRLETNFNEILIKIHTFSFKKKSFENVVWKIASILSQPQCVNKIYIARLCIA